MTPDERIGYQKAVFFFNSNFYQNSPPMHRSLNSDQHCRHTLRSYKVCKPLIVRLRSVSAPKHLTPHSAHLQHVHVHCYVHVHCNQNTTLSVRFQKLFGLKSVWNLTSGYQSHRTDAYGASLMTQGQPLTLRHCDAMSFIALPYDSLNVDVFISRCPFPSAASDAHGRLDVQTVFVPRKHVRVAVPYHREGASAA